MDPQRIPEPPTLVLLLERSRWLLRGGYILFASLTRARVSINVRHDGHYRFFNGSELEL